MKPFVESQDIVDDGAALNARMERDGYLFLKGLVPGELIGNVREQLLAPAAEAGWLAAGRPVSEAVAEPMAACVDPEDRYLQVLRRQYVLEAFHALKHHPAIIGLFQRMFGEPVLAHPLAIARNIFPQRPEFTTPPHQDYVHIQGTPETYAVWLPFSDVPLEMGGLTIAAGSHRQGVRDFRVSTGAGGLECSETFESDWVASPFERGDVIIFHSMVVHKGLPNLSDRLRQSLDARYSRASEPVMEISIRPYADIFTWDEVYAGWRSAELQYYWRDFDLQVVPMDMQYYERRDVMAFEIAAGGDVTARAALMRIVQRDPDAEKRTRAAAVLQSLGDAPASV